MNTGTETTQTSQAQNQELCNQTTHTNSRLGDIRTGGVPFLHCPTKAIGRSLSTNATYSSLRTSARLHENPDAQSEHPCTNEFTVLNSTRFFFLFLAKETKTDKRSRRTEKRSEIRSPRSDLTNGYRVNHLEGLHIIECCESTRHWVPTERGIRSRPVARPACVYMDTPLPWTA